MLTRVATVARWSFVPAALAALAIGLAARGTPPRATAGSTARPAATRRVAIRVDCGVPDACADAGVRALDIWSETRGPGQPLDVVVRATDLPDLRGYEVLDPDIDATAAAEHARLAAPRAADGGDGWSTEYHDYTATADHLHALAARSPGLVSVEAIGASLEQRPLWAVRIGHGPDKLLVEGTLHAREWIASAVTTCVADRLVDGYDRDPRIRDFVDHASLWMVPVVNPDGYQYTWSTNRYWRKNRRGDYGVDLNRNFSVAWGNEGSSRYRDSEIYRGEAPFSEPESAAIRTLANREHFTASIDFHAYGQLLLYPWSYTSKPAPDRDRLAAIGDRMASAMFAAHEHRYALQSGADLYAASGTMGDWMYADQHAAAYIIELRPQDHRKGRNGFVLPPAEIAPTCDEALAALLALRASK